MKALSLRRPWPWAVFSLDKDIENRDWYTSYRGPLAIHAAKGLTRDEMRGATGFFREIGAVGPEDELPWDTFEVGGIVGVCKLTDIIDYGCLPRSQKPHPKAESRWYMGSFGFVLEERRAIPFVPCRGMMGLFDLPITVDRAVRDAVAKLPPKASTP